MEYVETEGDSVDEAITKALKLLGAERERVEVEVDDPWLTTNSLGTGPYRRLLIIPEGARKRKEPEKRD